MKQLTKLMAMTVLILMQGCTFSETEFKPEGSQADAYKVSIYSDIFQQPATKVTKVEISL